MLAPERVSVLLPVLLSARARTAPEVASVMRPEKVVSWVCSTVSVRVPAKPICGSTLPEPDRLRMVAAVLL